MSKESNAEQMTGEQGFRQLYDRVHVPVFFNKLASDYNVHPANDDEARRLLDMGARLLQARDAELTKTASQQNNLLGLAEQRLDQALGDRRQSNDDQLVKQAADELLQDPELQQGALAYYNVLAQSQQ